MSLVSVNFLVNATEKKTKQMSMLFCIILEQILKMFFSLFLLMVETSRY